MFIIPETSYRVVKTKHKGRGIFATKDIEAGTVIGDYIGTIVRPEDELYTMSGGDRFDILANPKVKGIHFINHSCANNCGIYPYRGHVLFIALRHIFPGEEITINYMFGKAGDDEKDISCALHTCHCGSKICTGDLHESEACYDDFEKLSQRESGPWLKKIPGKYGEQLAPLESYPELIKLNNIKIYEYDSFGSEKKSPIKLTGASLPALAELRKHIRATGRQLLFPKLRLLIYGIRDGMLIAERK
jgi:hypothetical protein